MHVHVVNKLASHSLVLVGWCDNVFSSSCLTSAASGLTDLPGGTKLNSTFLWSREKGREGGREGGRKGGREGGRERGREGGRKGGREGEKGREGGREGGKG